MTLCQVKANWFTACFTNKVSSPLNREMWWEIEPSKGPGTYKNADTKESALWQSIAYFYSEWQFSSEKPSTDTLNRCC